MPQAAYTKDPTEILDYVINWRENDYLEDDEDILTSVWDISPSGLSEVTSSFDNTSGRCTLWVSGGTGQQTYTCTDTITTDKGRTCVRAITIRVADR